MAAIARGMTRRLGHRAGRAAWREDQKMIAAFSITPIGVGESVSDLVAQCVGIVRESGLANETNRLASGYQVEIDEKFRT